MRKNDIRCEAVDARDSEAWKVSRRFPPTGVVHELVGLVHNGFCVYLR